MRKTRQGCLGRPVLRDRNSQGFPRGGRKVGQGGHRVSILADERMGVAAHGQVDVRVPHEALGYFG